MSRVTSWLLLALCCAIPPATAHCARTVPSSVTSPQARVAYQTEDALDAISALQHAAIAARRQNVISTPTMRLVVKATMAAASTLSVAIDNGIGTQAGYKDALAALQSVRATLPAAEAQKVAVEFNAAMVILSALAR